MIRTTKGDPENPNPSHRHRLRIWASPVSLAVLVACGGGGGGSGSPSTPSNQAPTARVALAGESVANAVTTFDTAGSSDSDGIIASGTWNYGDGSTGSEPNHRYTSPGSFTATYTVTDDDGATASTSITVTVVKCSAVGTQAALLSPHATVCVQTSVGELVFEIFSAEAPITAANFLRYVDDGFYAGTLFHRVIAGFVAQGGGYTSGLVAKTATYPAIALETATGLKNWQYTLAMARTSQPDSATSQFYVNLIDNPALNFNPVQPGPNGYAVFGQVISGTAVIDAIGGSPTTAAGGLSDVPVQEVSIRSMVRLP
jgi:cyclophilin family peptidyl-prolyl cis-trans isomerase